MQLKMDERLPLRDVVFQTLRQAILTGELKSGERLMEIHLAQMLGVSRTPVREAIRMLQLDGLVVMIPRKGAHVASITEKHLSDVLEVRRALEELAVARACERITKQELLRLQKACRIFEEATLNKDPAAIARADEFLHNIIYRATKNDRLVALLSNLSEQMYRYRFEYIKDIEDYDVLIMEHESLYNALVQQDTAGACETIKMHIDNQAVGIFKIIE